MEKKDAIVKQISGKDAPTDTIVKQVIAKFEERSRAGIRKYGKTLDRDDLSAREWIRHFQEELMDAILYSERLLRDIE